MLAPMAMIVLIVEDSEEHMAAVDSAVRSMGYNTVCVNNSQHAMNYIRAGEVDIVLSDIVLPGLKGVSLIELARRYQPGIPFFLMTGDTYVTRDSIKNLGANGFFYKPLKYEDVQKALDALPRKQA